MKRTLGRGSLPFPDPTFLLLLLLIGLGFGLRLHQADAFSFWTDEGLTPLRASGTVSEILSNRIIIQEGVTNDTHPPFFFLIIHFTRQLWGETDFAYRFPSILFGVLLIPLLFQLGRRLAGRRAGIVAAVLTTVNPLQIWYANDARMYTLLVLLTAAATYVLWRAIQRLTLDGRNPKESRRTLIRCLFLYVLLAGLAIYTHYTAVFLIAVQGVFWGWLLRRQGYRKLLVGTAVLGALLAVPLVPYTIPRLFSGREANFYYVSPGVMLQDVVRFFALGVTVNYRDPAIILLTLGVLALLLVGLAALRGWLRRSFVLVYLLAVVVGLMAGTLLLKPMYQGVRHIMVGSPALLLLLATAVAYADHQARHGPRRWLSAIALGLSLLVALGGPLIALNNFYNDSSYTKDDYRSLVRFVESVAGASDVVVYNNAISLPMHRHYQQRSNLPVTASPIYPHFADSAPPQLTQLAQQYERIWFITDSPADGRDANGLVQAWLTENLALIGDYGFHARTIELRLLAFSTNPRQITTLPADDHSLNHQWAALPALVGAALTSPEPVNTPGLWLDLFWQGEAPPDRTGLRFTLRGPDGRSWWLEQVLPLRTKGSNWPSGNLIRQSYGLALPEGTPPGAYTVLAEPLNVSTDPPVSLGVAAPLLDVTLADSTHRPGAADLGLTFPAIQFANGVQLAEIEMADTAVHPGHNLPLVLHWQNDTSQALTNLRYELAVIGSNGEPLRQQAGPPGAPWLETWPAGVRLREPTGLYFPPETEPGDYELRWQLLQNGESVAGRPFWRPWTSEWISAGSVTVESWPLVTDLPTEAEVIQAQFGENIELYGYETAVRQNEIAVTLFWQAQADVDANYFSFVHLVNEQEEIVAQQGFVPVQGLRPTAGWRANELLTDTYTLPLPPDLPSSAYELRAGLYEPETFVRPSVTLNGQSQPDNQVVLIRITLP